MTKPWKAPPLKYLSAAEVEGLLPPVGTQLELVRETFAGIAEGKLSAPPATCLHPRPTGFADAMPAYSPERDLTTVKWICGDERNPALGLPYISGLMIVSDSDTGMPAAIMHGGAITAARTAAVTGVSVAALAPSGWSEVAMIGYGTQARAHLRVLRELNPAARFRVATRRPRAAEEAEPGVEFVPSPREAVAGAQVVITAIPLSARLQQPLVAEWLGPDALVLPLDDDACLDAGVVAEAGLFVVDAVDRYERDKAKGLFSGWRAADGDVAGALAAPPERRGYTVCMNQGIGLMDGPFADEVRRAAEKRGVGLTLER